MARSRDISSYQLGTEGHYRSMIQLTKSELQDELCNAIDALEAIATQAGDKTFDQWSKGIFKSIPTAINGDHLGKEITAEVIKGYRKVSFDAMLEQACALTYALSSLWGMCPDHTRRQFLSAMVESGILPEDGLVSMSDNALARIESAKVEADEILSINADASVNVWEKDTGVLKRKTGLWKIADLEDEEQLLNTLSRLTYHELLNLNLIHSGILAEDYLKAISLNDWEKVTEVFVPHFSKDEAGLIHASFERELPDGFLKWRSMSFGPRQNVINGALIRICGGLPYVSERIRKAMDT
ncbi:hypothetical protein ACYPKM_00430 [Pseudomonas aeruginosa]